jgi:hypothetical protein
MAGVSRSATVVIAYLMKTRNMAYNDAHAAVKDARAIVQPNHGFREQLKNFEKQLKNEPSAKSSTPFASIIPSVVKICKNGECKYIEGNPYVETIFDLIFYIWSVTERYILAKLRNV